VETLNEPFALVKTEPEAREGEAMTCSDFILCSTAVEAKQAFEITIGDSAEVFLFDLVIITLSNA